MSRPRIYTPEEMVLRNRTKVKRWRERNHDKNWESSLRWRRENPERWKAIKRKSGHKRNVELRRKVIALFGGKCAHCGYDKDPRAFQIDHINGGGWAERKIYITGIKLAKHVLEVNGEGYQLLCANCNQIKRFENKEDFTYKSEPCV